MNEDTFLNFADQTGDASGECDHLSIDPLCAPGSYDLGMDAVPHQRGIVTGNEVENCHSVLIYHNDRVTEMNALACLRSVPHSRIQFSQRTLKKR